jgi:adenosylcobinamide kinase / adenosylcobinamide-phosphate guanylyltransferase
MLTLVLGGARSGKSAYAQSLCADRAAVFIATARDVGDPEWRERIARHRRDRPPRWRTIEAPLALVETLEGVPQEAVALVDCLGVWVGNLMYEHRELATAESEAQVLGRVECVATIAARRETIVVSNEVGSATVPEHPVARRFRDMLGFANQIVARHAGRVVLVVAGIPMTVKDGGAR